MAYLHLHSLYHKIRQNKKVFIIVIAACVLALIFGYRLVQNLFNSMQRTSGPAAMVTVSATKVKKIDWQPYISSVATLQAVNGVNLATQVAGVINKIYFQSGQMIVTGQPIVSMDTSVLAAQLENAVAIMNYKKITFERYETLYKKGGVVTHDQYDAARSDYNQATALVNQIKAQIEQMTVSAPFSGKLGLRQVDLGQYVDPGAVITTLQQLDPIFVDFTVPTQNIPQVQVGQAIEVSVDSYPGKTYNGKITALDASIDQNTRGINVQGQVSNPKNELFPGMFGNVKILLPLMQDTLVVPDTAVVYTLYGNSVFIIQEKTDKNGKKTMIAVQRYITVGQRRGTEVAVLKGLNEGDTVVTSGQIKLQNNATVIVDNSAGI